MARRQGAPRRRGAPPLSRAVVFASRQQAAAAIAAAGAELVLVSARGLANAAGPDWVRAVIAKLRRPDLAVRLVLDVGDDAALAHRLIAQGDVEVLFTGGKAWRGKLRDIAVARGVRLWAGIAPSGRLR